MTRCSRRLSALALLGVAGILAAACSEPQPLDRVAPATTTSVPGTTPPDDPGPSTTPPPTTTEPGTGIDGLMFERAEGDALVDDAPTVVVGDVEPATPERPALIVGSVTDPESQLARGAVWLSAAPSTGGWERIDVAPESDDQPEVLSTVTATEEGWLAGGTVGIGRARVAAVWRIGVDGVANRVDADGLTPATDVGIDQLAGTPTSGFTAAGSVVEDGDERPAVWTSGDGVSWQRAVLTVGADEDVLPISGVTSGPAGVVVTAGVVSPTGDQDAASWLSADGSTWERSPSTTLGGFDDQSILSVTTSGDRYVAVGATEIDFQLVPTSWFSLDGITWSNPERAFADIGDGRITSNGRGAAGVVADGSTLYARSTSSYLAQVWRSTDGSTWTSVGDLGVIRPSGVDIDHLVTDGASIVALTGEPEMLVNDGATWSSPDIGQAFPRPSARSTTSAVAYADGTFVAVGARELPASGAAPASVLGIGWVSSDAATWEADQVSFSAGPVLDVAGADGQGFVAVGREDPAAVTDRNPRALAWRSADGASWEPIDLTPVIPPDGSSLLRTVALTPRGFVAGGWEFTDRDVEPLLITYDDGVLTSAGPDVFTFGFGLGEESVTAVCAWEGGGMVAFASVESDSGTEIRAAYALDRSPWGPLNDVDGSFASSDAQVVERCTYGGPDHWLAVGSRRDGSDVDAAVWESVGGTEWSFVAAPGAFSGPGTQGATGAVRVNDTWLVLGEDDSALTPVATVWGEGADGWTAFPSPTGLEAPGPNSGGAMTTSGGIVVATGVDIGRAGLWYTPAGQIGGESPL